MVRGYDGGPKPNNNNIGAESPKPNTASQDPLPQVNNETGKPERARKLGEPRHDIQKVCLQWQYDQKQSKYKHITHAGRVSFVPLIAASNGAIHKETKFILSLAARRIAEKSGTATSRVMGWLRAGVTVVILRAASMQLRCERGGSKQRNLGVFNAACVGSEVFRS